jgi:DNA-directed RNA polymerase specialized sigma24 family protein
VEQSESPPGGAAVRHEYIQPKVEPPAGGADGQAKPETCDGNQTMWELEEDPLRVAGDAELIEILRAEGFAGRNYDELVDRLVRYALAVLQGWIANGWIFVLVENLGWGLPVTDRQRDRLRRDFDEISGLAAETVAPAFVKFEQEALKGGGWDPRGGTQLTTFFLGAVIQSFPNAFRRWARKEDPPLPSGNVQTLRTAVDPAVTLSQNHDREVLLSELSENQRRAIEMTESGYPQAEIAEYLGTTERAVEGLLRRSRAKLRRYDR